MTTGMTVAERWMEVGRRVEMGDDSFSQAVRGVFNEGPGDLVGDGWNQYVASFTDDDDEYVSPYAMLAYFLSLEAEDAATQDAEPYPPTADVVAEEEPIQTTTTDLRGLLEAQRQYNERMYAGMQNIATFRQADPIPERRKSWNAKLADGLRKWAHWLEERF